MEFAIELDNGLLPIDAKFPSAYYDNYIEAAESEEPNSKERRKKVKETENEIKRII